MKRNNAPCIRYIAPMYRDNATISRDIAPAYRYIAPFPGTLARCTGAVRRFPGALRQLTRAFSRQKARLRHFLGSPRCPEGRHGAHRPYGKISAFKPGRRPYKASSRRQRKPLEPYPTAAMRPSSAEGRSNEDCLFEGESIQSRNLTVAAGERGH